MGDYFNDNGNDNGNELGFRRYTLDKKKQIAIRLYSGSEMPFHS